jgi:hypothetical protein
VTLYDVAESAAAVDVYLRVVVCMLQYACSAEFTICLFVDGRMCTLLAKREVLSADCDMVLSCVLCLNASWVLLVMLNCCS